MVTQNYIIENLQVQFMQVFDDEELDNTDNDSIEITSQVSTIDMNEGGESLDVNTKAMDIIDGETETYVETGMDESVLEVYVNGILMDPQFYDYDADSGKLLIMQSPAGIISVEAHEKDELTCGTTSLQLSIL